nr:maltose transport inner membrane protein [Salmonella sp. NCTC 7297]
MLFPLVCTIAIAFTNYSSTNQLTFERAQQVLMDRSYQQAKPITSVFTRQAMSGNWLSPTGKRAKITSPTRFPSAANKNYS